MSEIVLATPDDKAAIEPIVENAYSHYIERIGTKPGPMRDDYADYIDRGYVRVLKDENGVAALIVLIAEPDAMLLDNVAVAPHAQGKGYGRLLMEFAEQQTRDAGLTTIRLYTHELMTENQAIYKKRGYIETHRAEQNGLKRVFMEKSINA